MKERIRKFLLSVLVTVLCGNGMWHDVSIHCYCCRWIFLFLYYFLCIAQRHFYSIIMIGHLMLWLVHFSLSLHFFLINLFVAKEPPNTFRGQIYNQFGTHSLIFIHIFFWRPLSFALLSFIVFVMSACACIKINIVRKMYKLGLSITIWNDFCAAVVYRLNG